jgi:hypothetical protein
MKIPAITPRLPRVLATLAACAIAPAGAPAQQPPVGAPPGAKLVLDAAAQGVQIYTCEKKSDGYRWVFSAPDAALFDPTGRQVGTHFAGPTWQMQDGSRIVGEVAAQAPAAEPHAISWLLLHVKSHAGNGLLDNVGLVRRVDTHGGTAPDTGCDATKATEQARMRYTARYLFYTSP